MSGLSVTVPTPVLELVTATDGVRPPRTGCSVARVMVAGFSRDDTTSIATSAAPGLVAMASGYMTMNAAGSTTTLATPSENPAALPFRVVLPTERPCTYTVPASVPVTPLNVTLAAPAVPADFDRVATAASLLTMVTSLGASGTASSVIVTGICRLTPTFALGTCTPGTSSVATSPAPRVRTTRAPRRPQPGVSTDLMPVTITNVPMGGGVPG